MELVELGIGEDGAGAEGHGDTVSGGYGGVCGVEVKLAGAAAGEDDGVGGELLRGACGGEDFEASHAVVFEREVAGEGVF